MIAIKQSGKRQYHVILSLVVLAMFFAQHVFASRLFAAAGIAILCVMVLFLNVNELYYAYALLLPNTYIIKIWGNNAALVGYWLLLVVVKMVITNFRSLPFNKKMLRHIIIHVFLALLSMCVTYNFSQLASLFRFLLTLLLLNYLMCRESFDTDKVFQQYILGVILNMMLGLVYYLVKHINVFNGQFASIGNDRNYFSITLAFAVNLIFAYSYKTNRITVTSVVQALFMVVGIILSGSRTAFLVVIPAMMTLVFSLLKGKQKAISKLFVILVLIAGAFFLRYLLVDSIRTLMNRFLNDSAKGGNGRLELWNIYLGYTFSSFRNLLFGVGNSVDFVLMGITKQVEHNTLIEMLFAMGIMGTVSLLLVYFDVYRLSVPQKQKNSVVAYFPLLCIVVGYMTINGLYSENLTFAIVLASLIIGRINGKTKEIPISQD